MTTFALWRKLLRDLRVPLISIMLLVFAFQLIWVKVVQRITTQISPMLELVSVGQGMGQTFLMDMFFRGPGKLFQTMLGGENLTWGNPQDLLAVGYMHPVMLIILGIWAVGRASIAIAGEIDRGTMELLLAQPIPRSRILFAHFGVDLVVIPSICLAMWLGSLTGTALFSPFVIGEGVYRELGLRPPSPLRELHADATPLWIGVTNTAMLLFAISGYTFWLSAAGRSRNRVMGIAILVSLTQFMINVIGQLWDGIAFLRPFTVFYYYQPQRIVLHDHWIVDPGAVWGGKSVLEMNVMVVLGVVGVLGYLLALRCLVRRDIPAPL